MIKDLDNKLVKYCTELNLDLSNLSILNALSGGVDSLVLSKLLIELRSKYNFKLLFAHFNHKMHGKANEMQRLCKDFAQKNKVQLFNDIISIPENHNIEAYSRSSRYQKLNKIAIENKIQLILTAHHYDDQIETLFMKYIDNADWISRIGIRSEIGLIRRPLLNVRKKNIINYAKVNDLDWIEDPTNKDVSFRRNKIRMILLPKAKDENVMLERMLLDRSIIYKNRMSDILIRFYKNKKNIIKKSNKYFYILRLKEIGNYEVEELKILIYWLASEFIKTEIGIFSRGFWLNFKNFINTAKTGSHYSINKITFLLNRGEVYVTKSYYELLDSPSKIRLTKKSTWYNSFLEIHDDRKSIMESDFIKFIPTEIINDGLFIRRWEEGDRIFTKSLNEKLVSDLFIENKISIMSKLLHPIIVDKHDAIIWIPGLVFSSRNYRNLEQNEFKQVEWKQL